MRKLVLTSIMLIILLVITSSIFGAITITSTTSPNPVNVGSWVNFTIGWEPDEVGSEIIRICKDSSCTNCGGGITVGCYANVTVASAPWTSPGYLTSTANETDTNITFYIRITNSTNSTTSGTGTLYVNHRPAPSSVVISPSTNNATSTLTCNYTFADMDGDTESANTTANYKWYRNNEGLGQNFIEIGQTGRTLQYVFDKDDEIFCAVRTYDQHNFEDDEFANSSVVTIGNLPPVASSVSILQTAPQTNEDLNCTYSFSDPDADSDGGSTVKWHLNGAYYITRPSLPNSDTIEGDNWSCSVIPYDGTDYGSEVMSLNISIIGTAPTLVTLTDNSSSVNRTKEGNNITFSVNWTDINYAELAHIYICNSSSIVAAGCAGKTYCSSDFSLLAPQTCTYEVTAADAVGDNAVTYYAAVCDDTGYCSAAQSGTFYVNHAPSITSITLNSDVVNFTDNANLLCNVVGQTDADAQDVNNLSLTYYWTYNRSGVMGVYDAPNDYILTHGNTNYGDRWRCNVSISDGINTVNYASDWKYISSNNGLGENGSPFIINFTLDSNKRILVGDTVNFTVLYNATGEVSLYVCNSSAINRSGCNNKIFSETNFTTNNPIKAQYTVEYTNNGTLPFWLMVCDHDGGLAGEWRCSNFETESPYRVYLPGESMGNFSVNHKPDLTSVNILADNYEVGDNLTCSASGWDYEAEPISYSYSWYLNNGSGFTLMDVPNSNILSNQRTSEGDYWICQVTANDTSSNSTAMNSSQAYITSSDGYPNIINYSDNSNGTSRVNIGQYLGIEVYWNDTDTDEVYLYVCNSSNIYQSGCGENSLGHNKSTENPITVYYVVPETDLGTMNYWIRVCDTGDNGNWKCSETIKDNYTVNHIPTINSVVVASDNAFYDNDNLYCNVDYTDTDGDSVNITYIWYFQQLDGAQFDIYATYINDNQLANGVTTLGDQWYCTASVSDDLGVTPYSTSSTVTISENAGATPIVIEYSDNSDPQNPTTVADDFQLTINWSDSDNAYTYIYVCNTSSIATSGCLGGTYATALPSYSNLATLSFTMPSQYNGTLNYYFKLCDVSGGCSSVLSGQFTVNHRPTVSNVNITSDIENMTENSNIYCNGDTYDSDGNDVNSTYKWFVKPNGSSSFTPFTYSVDNYVVSSNVNTGESWICEITPTDLFTNGTAVNSSAIVVGQSEIGTPTILEVADNSDPASPIGVNSLLQVSLSWLDTDSSEWRVYLCNSSNIHTSGCLQSKTYNFTTSYTTTATLNYNVFHSDSTHQDYYVRVCDSSLLCSNIAMGNFSVNHRPYASNVQISPASANATTGLSCGYTFNNNDTGILDSTDSTTSYRWYLQTTGQGEFTQLSTNNQNISAQYDKNDVIKCAVMAMDNQGLTDSGYRNSSEITIQNAEPSILVSVTPSYPTSSENLLCYDITTDPDGDDLSTSYKWYNNNVELSLYPFQTLYKMFTSAGDNWSCEVTASDGDITVTQRSANVTIGAVPAEEVNTSEVPRITSLTSDSLVNIDNNVTVYINWSDTDDNEQARFIVCNDTNIINFACLGTSYCYDLQYTTSQMSCSFNTSIFSGSTVDYFAMVCDDNENCSAVANSTFIVNQRPVSSNIALSPAAPTIASNISCSYTYSDEYSEKTGLTEYNWYINNTLASTSRFLSTGFSRGDSINCTVRVYDAYNLSDSSFRSSASVIVQNTAPSPSITALLTSNATVLLTASQSSDLDSDSLTYRYDCDGSDNLDYNASTSNTTWNCLYASAGNYTVFVQVNDSFVTNYTSTNISVPGFPRPCSDLTNGMQINTTITICADTYEITDTIDITASNIILSCNSSIINCGASTIGLSINSKNNITVQDCTFNSCSNGISLENANYISIKDSYFNNNNNGAYLYTNNYNNLTNNTFSNNSNKQVYVLFANNTILADNTLANSTSIGLHIEHTNYTSLLNNTITGSNRNLQLDSNQNLTMQENLVNSLPVYYYESIQNTVIENIETSHLEINFGSNLTLNNVTLASGDGILLKNINNSRIENSTITNSYLGVYVSGNNNEVLNNTLSNISNYAIHLNGTNETVKTNVITRSNTAIYSLPVTQESNSSLINNSMLHNSYGVYFYNADNYVIDSNYLYNNTYAIYFYSSKGNNLTWNSIKNNTYAVYFDNSNNTLTLSTLQDNIIGLYLTQNSANNSIIFNNFINNTNYSLMNVQPVNITARYNYWGTSDSTLINETMIFDYWDNTTLGGVEASEIGQVTYNQFLLYPMHCYNNVIDNNELEKDCGGSCSPCATFNQTDPNQGLGGVPHVAGSGGSGSSSRPVIGAFPDQDISVLVEEVEDIIVQAEETINTPDPQKIIIQDSGQQITGAVILDSDLRKMPVAFGIIIVICISALAVVLYMKKPEEEIEVPEAIGEMGELRQMPVFDPTSEVDQQALEQQMRAVHDYIMYELAKGVPQIQIEKSLLQLGWRPGFIQDVFNLIYSKQSQPVYHPPKRKSQPRDKSMFNKF